MKVSGRNQLKGRIKSVETSGLMGKVMVELDAGQLITSIITADSVKDLNLNAGDQVVALVKSTSTMIMK